MHHSRFNRLLLSTALSIMTGAFASAVLSTADASASDITISNGPGRPEFIHLVPGSPRHLARSSPRRFQER